ncbi:uncharacterized protein LOC128227033 [Mya arenaria]|uniref:uncharacterized protein LOC128227033 n=1 Tax=Mya arenaria TaxID=6604 RepID=UPI0022E4976D|nr:uncharacterized protein LOC128227033 [Mya arenaria]
MVVLLIYCCICKKKDRPRSGLSSSKSFMKSMFFSRSSTVLDLHQNGEILVMPAPVQTNIFDLDLPNASHKGNLLPPLHQPIGTTDGNIRNGPAMTRMVSDLKEPGMKVETPIPNVVWDINHPDISKPAFYSEAQHSDLKKPD